MKAPLRPANEEKRLETLRQYDLLDTLPEQALDDLTALAAHICDAPMSLISLVDDQRQWFKSRIGMAATETPRDISFCGHAILEPDVFVVPDVTLDERFMGNPLVTGDPGIGFYAGAPLVTAEGDAIGTLCIMDHVPRELNPSQIEALRILSRQVVAQFALRRQTRQLIASEARYRTLFEHAPDGILIADPQSFYLEANASICDMLGYSRGELVGMHASDIVAPDEHVRIARTLASVESKAGLRQEWQFRRKDGSSFPVETLATVMPDGNLLGVIRDVTERKRTDARFRRLVESNAQGIMFWKLDGQITGANDAFLELVGFTRKDLEAGRLNWKEMTPPEYTEADIRCAEVLADVRACAPYEKEFIRKDGSRVHVLTGAAAFEDNPSEGLFFILDLTERRKLEQQFLRAQRMESIGTLAGGIAHDLNNVLAPILMSVDLLKDLARNEDDLALLDTLESSAQHGADLVKQVLSFARGMEGRRITINPLHLVDDVLKVIRDTFPKSIDVRFTPARDVWTITGDPTQIHQVFMNLCVNARDAMPRGGKLILGLENIVLDEASSAGIMDGRAGEYVVATVADTGIGIPPAIRDRLFEPFFTTKRIGEGTGLGLSTTLAIVKSHYGFIQVDSELGAGTQFRIYLPANTSELATAREEGEQSLLAVGNGELVLVVDDEEAIRSIVKRTLERYGYRVVLATNGAEAVAIYSQRQMEIAIVLTDMAMPVMDGPATILALKKINPGVKIIASSGLSSSTAVAAAGVRHFVPKPYKTEIILQTLNQVLREA